MIIVLFLLGTGIEKINETQFWSLQSSNLLEDTAVKPRNYKALWEGGEGRCWVRVPTGSSRQVL